MKLLDEKLVEEAAKELGNEEVPQITDGYSHGLKVGIEFGFERGVSFAEQQLKEKMIAFAEWCTENYLHKGTAPSGKEMWIDRDYYIDYKTTKELLEQFLNKE